MCNITLSTVASNGKMYTYYTVRHKGKRHLFKTKSDAQAFIKTQDAALEHAGRHAASVIAKNPVAVMTALDILEKAGLSVDHIADAAREYAKRNALKHANATLKIMARDYLRRSSDRISAETLSAATQAVTLLTQELGEDCIPSTLSSADFIRAMDSIGEGRAPATFNSILRRLKTFARWAERNEYPIRAGVFDAIDPRHVFAKEPRFIKPEEMKRLLDHVFLRRCRNVASLIALQFYAGIRSSEVRHLRPEDYHYMEDEPYVRVSQAKGASCGRRGRIVPLEPVAADIMRSFCGERLPEIYPETMTSLYLSMDEVGITDRNNIARHSFITYHVAKYGNDQKTVTLCGTSKEMAAVHYKGLATKSQAEEYFNLPYRYIR